MGRIRILPDQVANKIAAGEVVERPASVVKELLENSLDAGATELRIEVEAGGRRLIRIVDDGCGMLRDDALLAFERHATSKLRDVKDLLSIATLGFRGEALPSIASVSRLLLETRSPEETTGTRIEIAGGKMLRCEEAALGGGTVITVRDLFYNVPARKKFLRTEQTELAHIASLVTHYSLAHPGQDASTHQRAHRTAARHAGRDRCRSASTRCSAARRSRTWSRSACARQQLPGCRPRSGDERARRRRRSACSGFFSRPQVQKGNRNSIYIFVNGRLIRDRLLMHALSSAYHNLMPPACVSVRAAVPRVRRRRGGRERAPVEDRGALPPRQSFVHDFVRDTIRERLMESRPAPSFSPRAAGAADAAARRPRCRTPNSARCSRTRRPSVRRTSRSPSTAPAAGDLPAVRPASRAPAPRRVSISRAPPIEVTPGAAAVRQTAAPPRRARRISRRRRPAARVLALGALRAAPARPDPRELHHRRGPRRPVDHRPARRARAHPVRAGA